MYQFHMAKQTASVKISKNRFHFRQITQKMHGEKTEELKLDWSHLQENLAQLT
jgi:hypothetical protein